MGENKIRACFDGCCEPRNPGGHMGVGAVVWLNDKVRYEYSKHYLESKSNTNNVAEYLGLINICEYLLSWAAKDQEEKFDFFRIDIRGDSKMVVMQINGQWRIKAGYYTQYATKAKNLWAQLTEVCKQRSIALTLQWHSRDMNGEADKLSKAHLIYAGVKFMIQPNNL